MAIHVVGASALQSSMPGGLTPLHALPHIPIKRAGTAPPSPHSCDHGLDKNMFEMEIGGI